MKWTGIALCLAVISTPAAGICAGSRDGGAAALFDGKAPLSGVTRPLSAGWRDSLPAAPLGEAASGPAPLETIEDIAKALSFAPLMHVYESRRPKDAAKLATADGRCEVYWTGWEPPRMDFMYGKLIGRKDGGPEVPIYWNSHPAVIEELRMTSAVDAAGRLVHRILLTERYFGGHAQRFVTDIAVKDGRLEYFLSRFYDNERPWGLIKWILKSEHSCGVLPGR